MNSMTGFGRSLAILPHTSFQIEISGINRKQVEIAINMPRSWNTWEHRVRALITGSISRGRVNVSISPAPSADSSTAFISLDETKLSNYIDKLNRIKILTGEHAHLEVGDLLRMGILHDETEQESSLSDDNWNIIQRAITKALDEFLMMRAKEGEHLKQDVFARLATLRDIKEKILQRSALVPGKWRENLMKRLEDAGLPVDLSDERIVKEIALFADRCDTSEETARLDSHFAQFMSICEGKDPAGRPLDFLCQEIFREFNTIGSKANDAELSHLIVSGKTELEKIREQVQNIE